MNDDSSLTSFRLHRSSSPHIRSLHFVQVLIKYMLTFLSDHFSFSVHLSLWPLLSSSTHSLHSVQDLVVRCMQQMVCAKASNIRSGWKNIFSVFTLAAATGDQAIVEMAFESTSELMIFIVSGWCEWQIQIFILRRVCIFKTATWKPVAFEAAGCHCAQTCFASVCIKVIHTYTYKYICIHIHTYTYKYIICIHIHTYTYKYICVHISEDTVYTH